MIYIPGFIIATATFPGVILHEIAHKFFCDLYHVPVYKVMYFAVSKNAGHVIHAPIKNPKINALVGLAPLLINSIVCLLFLAPVFLPFYIGTSFLNIYTMRDIFLVWIGLSCGFNALPSKADLAHIDKNVSWPLSCIKKIVQILNFGDAIGSIVWLLFLFFVSFFIFCPIFLFIMQSLLY